MMRLNSTKNLIIMKNLIYGNILFLEELISEGIYSSEEIEAILIDIYSGSSTYDFHNEKLIISVSTKIIFNFNLIRKINNIDEYLNSFRIKSIKKNLKINEFEYKSEYIG